MISIKTSKLEIDDNLKKKIEIICSFNDLKPKFINGTTYYYYHCKDCNNNINETSMQKN